jgi:hypothetical protein
LIMDPGCWWRHDVLVEGVVTYKDRRQSVFLATMGSGTSRLSSCFDTFDRGTGSRCSDRRAMTQLCYLQGNSRVPGDRSQYFLSGRAMYLA